MRVTKMDYAIFFFRVVAYFIGRDQVEAYENAKKEGESERSLPRYLQ